jgi:hypothetical protein
MPPILFLESHEGQNLGTLWWIYLCTVEANVHYWQSGRELDEFLWIP